MKFLTAAATAMACGVKTNNGMIGVTPDETPYSSILELLQRKGFRTGLVATSAQEYADAIRYLIAHPDEAARMGRAGREKAARLYRAQTLAAVLETLYHELLTRKGISQ